MKNILIVDDEKFVRMGLKTMIQRSELCKGEIIECKNGKEALDELSKNDFDLIISDIKMPITTGIELITKIKEEQLSKAKIIMISGYDDFDYAVNALRFGATDYLLKPIDREVLLKLLKKIDFELDDEKIKDVKTIELNTLNDDLNEDKQHKIQRAVEYVNENYSQNINMALVSNEVSMNYTFFSETFKEVVGESFVDYLKLIRINMAKKLLRTSNISISKVSEEVGFNNEKHFSKTFKIITGQTPSEYRKSCHE